MIRKLRDLTAETPQYTTHSAKMVKIARDYHEALQYKDLASWEERQKATDEVLEKIPDSAKLTTRAKGELAEKIKESDVRTALKKQWK